MIIWKRNRQKGCLFLGNLEVFGGGLQHMGRDWSPFQGWNLNSTVPVFRLGMEIIPYKSCIFRWLPTAP